MTIEPAAATTERPAPRSGRRGKGYFLPGGIALLALLGLGLFVGAGDLSHPAARILDGPTIASQIALGIQTEESAAQAPKVSCPPSEPVRQGLRFTCTDRGAGGGSRPARTVYVTEVDGRGQVHWSWQAGP